MAELDEFALHPPVSPGRIVDGHADNELADRGCRARPSGTPTGRVVPSACDQLSVPGEQRRRGHREHLAPSAPGDQPGQGRKPQPVARLVADPPDLTAQHRVLMPEHEEFGILGHLTPGQHHQAAQQTPREQVGDGEDHSAMIPAPEHCSSRARSRNRASAWERRKPAHVAELRPGAGSIPASCRISQTVEAATFTPSTSSSLCTLRVPPSWILADHGSTRTRIERTVRGRPGRRGPDRRACRRPTRSRCQRSTVSGRTTRCSCLSTSPGIRCSSVASKARSPGVNRTLSGPSCRAGPGAGGAARRSRRPCLGCSSAVAAAARTRSPHRDRPIAAARSITMPQRSPSPEHPAGRYRAQHRHHSSIGSNQHG